MRMEPFDDCHMREASDLPEHFYPDYSGMSDRYLTMVFLGEKDVDQQRHSTHTLSCMSTEEKVSRELRCSETLDVETRALILLIWVMLLRMRRQLTAGPGVVLGQVELRSLIPVEVQEMNR